MHPSETEMPTSAHQECCVQTGRTLEPLATGPALLLRAGDLLPLNAF